MQSHPEIAASVVDILQTPLCTKETGHVHFVSIWTAFRLQAKLGKHLQVRVRASIDAVTESWPARSGVGEWYQSERWLAREEQCTQVGSQ